MCARYSDDDRLRSFDWPETGRLLSELASAYEVVADERGGFLVREPAGPPRLRFVPPACLPPVAPGEDPSTWIRRLPAAPGAESVVLLQAGAAALGRWDDDQERATKVFKRYVARGHGRAQPAHLATRGKSRYGSRLRLQMARRLLDEVVERLRTWEASYGPADVVHRACADRLWAELCHHRPPPPFAADDPRLRRVRLDVHVPDLSELHRVRRALRRGHLQPCTPRA